MEPTEPDNSPLSLVQSSLVSLVLHVDCWQLIGDGDGDSDSNRDSEIELDSDSIQIQFR